MPFFQASTALPFRTARNGTVADGAEGGVLMTCVLLYPPKVVVDKVFVIEPCLPSGVIFYR